MRGIFEDELKKLHGKFTEMGINVSEAIYRASKSFIDHDKELAQQVIRHDEEINEEEIKLEDQALMLIALQQPVATDFRRIIIVLKASSDLERIGDHAVGIARESIQLKGEHRVAEIENDIAEMTNNVRAMLEEVLDAYVKEDETSAKKIADTNQKIDEEYAEVREKIIKMMKQDAKVIKGSTSYLMVASYLERIGDHISNVAEWVVYNETGHLAELTPDRHPEES
ncbi:phosphate signaling complex protein PhoU [Pediococcus ethanolidurans]|uniref:Phosphate-specific transport system accessory protein PhoU n=1 Tax=Pediococcus ethanolidurans TaxID=319653 RepID=A0A0R2K6X8_9LACO|nr:phosphate signaling complex protein PhoU [Pediococcus ethanolidurans]KRN82231.1 phoU protein [Pediococcus ethanolidurans]MBU7555318.1 phosphate signaling complex protein PhoU [Pediococcus ethanolidurans]MBU7562798.1 phosphate signaling complex protein PhoU [Pediococcus ethanolidurans]MCT4397993.1 phosphate signaling complex protein PhoU [Pediococcus ethanolidurans]MCV3314757.1 phosphate signaling complex protein PhoU [Pediococcus ethanolidurans]